MAKGTRGERILYPCYFNAGYSRREGRRVRQEAAIKAPVITDLERALKRAGVKYRVEEHYHPAYWARRESRIVAEWAGGKEELLKRVSQKLVERK